MPHNPEAVQQWAKQIIQSPYWEDVKETVRAEMTKELINAAHVGDDNAIKGYSCMLRTLDEVVCALGALSIDTHRSRRYFETAHESEELEDAK